MNGAAEFGRAIRVTPVPAGLGPVVDLAPVDGPGAVWLALCEDGRIVRWSLETGRWSTPARAGVTVPVGVEPWDGRQQRRRLHASADGRFAAVVLDYGVHGEVFDLRTGARRLVLHGGDGDTDTVPFHTGDRAREPA
ncbi:hypothetical protein [Kitasatospora sp. P5_F3]